MRRDRVADVRRADLDGAEIVHIPYTDKLFADDCAVSATRFAELAGVVSAHGAALSVTLHDLPVDDSALGRRRFDAYQQVIAVAQGIVVNSDAELDASRRFVDQARSFRMIPLPVVDAERRSRSRPDGGGPVVVLGFVFPDRGYEHTIDELPAESELILLGRPAAGHETLPAALADRAAARGHRLTVTGFVPDAELSAALHRAGVPVAPNRRVLASASINTWLAHGRRPLVPLSVHSRTLAERWPDTLTLYDADRPGELQAAVARARREPDTTWLDGDVRIGPSPAEVAAGYLTHFAGCSPPRLLTTGSGRVVLPDNRWDLLDDRSPDASPAVSVVIPYFENQPGLDLVLTALTRQRYPADRLQIVVADDGSVAPPTLAAAAPIASVLVRQPNRGFRAAAARNLGAAAADGTVLLFLDGDTVPEPDYVARMVRLPGCAPDVLAVGRRRHADLTGWTPAMLVEWMSDQNAGSGRPGRGAPSEPRELPEPAWLIEGYRRSADLLHADDRSYRHVISAVLGMHRDLFREIDGFSPEFTAYGGEDWELAHRARVAGAVFAHVRDAVAWHDGADWAAREAPAFPTAEARRTAGTPSASAASKNIETLQLSRLLPDPRARGAGQWCPYTAIIVELPAGDPGAVLVTARSAFGSGADCGLWLTGDDAPAVVGLLGDPRIRVGPPPADVAARASVWVELTAPTRLDGLREMAGRAADSGSIRTPTGVFYASRVRHRSARWSSELTVQTDLLGAVLFGGRDAAEPHPLGPFDLARELGAIRR